MNSITTAILKIKNGWHACGSSGSCHVKVIHLFFRFYAKRRNSDNIWGREISHFFDNFPRITRISRLNPPFQGRTVYSISGGNVIGVTTNGIAAPAAQTNEKSNWNCF